MSGPLAATGVPGAGRMTVCGLSPEIYPHHGFYRANFGGRFATTLKLAGWDGIVIEGKADRPAWINIIDETITVEDAKYFKTCCQPEIEMGTDRILHFLHIIKPKGRSPGRPFGV
jgi:aldehyde:ferredoxin oxidoreductase